MLTYRNIVFIVVLVFYCCTAVFSAVRLIQYGFKKATSERILLVFSIGRILCSAFQLATTSDPTNTSLWAGYVTTFSICVSLLISSSLVLLRRLAQRAGSDFPTFLNRNPMTLCQSIVYVGLILGIAGGIKANKNWDKTGHYSSDGLLKASNGIFLASWIITILMTSFTLGRASGTMVKKERLAVAGFAISLPLLLVRIVYSFVSAFFNPQSFSSIYGDVTVMLCMALLEEMAIALVYQGLGMVTLEKERRSESV